MYLGLSVLKRHVMVRYQVSFMWTEETLHHPGIREYITYVHLCLILNPFIKLSLDLRFVVFTHRQISFFFWSRRNWKKWWSGVGKVLREQKRWVWRFSAPRLCRDVLKKCQRFNVPKNGRLKLGKLDMFARTCVFWCPCLWCFRFLIYMYICLYIWLYVYIYQKRMPWLQHCNHPHQPKWVLLGMCR